MYRVLEVEPASFSIGGTEQFILKNTEHLDRSNFVVDFLCCGLINDKTGFNHYQLSFNTAEALSIDYGILKPWKIFAYLRKFLKSRPYDIVHIHNGFISNIAVCAAAAHIAGIKHIICHLHGTDLADDPNKLKAAIKSIRKKADLQLLTICATDFYTCSNEAAERTFGRKFLEKNSVQFFPNAIDVKEFIYNPALRESIRSHYHLDDHFIVGTVGRLSPEKNQLFLLDIFQEIIQKQKNSVLMLVGDGPGKQAIESRIRQLHLENNVILTGSVSNVNAYLQAFDVFVLPSFTEAYPIVMVEAQAAGLPTVVSDVITRETAITDLVQFVSLKEPAISWSRTVLSHANRTSPCNRQKVSIHDSFDIQKSGKNLENKYLSILNVK